MRIGLIALAGVAAAGLAAPGLAACSSSTPAGAPAHSSSPATVLGTATVGTISITGAYIPEPASPDVAAAYLTVTDHGASGDTLTGASSTAAASVQLHETVENGNAGTMVPLTSVPIPAGGAVTFRLGQRHLMLMNPRTTLTTGQHVPITLVFAKAGTVVVSVPVVPATGPQDPMTGMSGMSGMSPGMSMPG